MAIRSISNAAAAEIAIAIKAEKLIFLTEQVGIEENGELLPVMSVEQFREGSRANATTPPSPSCARSSSRVGWRGSQRAHR